MKKINEMMISAYLKGMSKLNAFKDNESGEVNADPESCFYRQQEYGCDGL